MLEHVLQTDYVGVTTMEINKYPVWILGYLQICHFLGLNQGILRECKMS